MALRALTNHRAPRGPQPRRPALLQLAALAAIALVGAALIEPIRIGRFADFHVFWTAGGRVLDGQSPYPGLHDWVMYHNRAWAYPLPAAWLFAAFAALPYGVAAYLWTALSIAAVVAALRLVARADAITIVAVLAASVTLRGLAIGTVNAVLFALVLTLAALRERPRASGALFAGMLALKPLMLPVGVYVLVEGRLRALVAALATGTLLLAASIAGGFSPSGYLALLGRLSQLEQVNGFSTAAALISVGQLGTGTARTITTLLAVALALATLVLGLRGLIAHQAVLAGAIVATLVASPIVWSHYLLLLFAPLVLLPRPRRPVIAMSVYSWLVFLPFEDLPDSLRAPGRNEDLLLAVLMPLAMLALVIGRTGGIGRRGQEAPGAIALAEPTAALPAP